MQADNEQHWKVGELARATGLTVRALHHYDRLGLLAPSERTYAGYRLYSEADVRRLYRIVALRRLGLALVQIGELLDGDHNGEGLDQVISHQLEQVERQLTDTQRLRDCLLAIRDELAREGEPSIDQLIDTMEVITMSEKYYTPEQREQLGHRREQVGEEQIEAGQRAWAEIFAELRAAQRAGTDPADATLAPVRERARELVGEFTGGDAGISQSLRKMWANEDPEALSRGMIDRELWDYYMRVCKAGDAG